MKSILTDQEYDVVALDALRPHPKNPRRGNVESIAESVSVNGFYGAVVAQRSTGYILAGNHRWKAASSAGMSSIPVIWLDCDDDAAHRILLVDNRTNDVAGYDNTALAEVLSQLALTDAALAGTGYDADDLDKLVGSIVGPVAAESPIDVEDIDPITKPGDTWVMGRHIVLCGDAMVSRGIGGGFPTLVFDPPWDAGIAVPKRNHTLAFCDGQRLYDVVQLFGPPTWAFAWDCVSSWYTPNRPLRRMKQCLWYGALEYYDQDGSHYGEPEGSTRTVTNTRGSYEYTPDPRGKHLSDLFACPITALHSQEEHPHSKPLDWVRMLLANCTRGDIYDPFLGSGTTLIAAEQLGRTCHGVELIPENCDIIVRRWEQLTGQTAVLNRADGISK